MSLISGVKKTTPFADWSVAVISIAAACSPPDNRFPEVSRTDGRAPDRRTHHQVGVRGNCGSSGEATCWRRSPVIPVITSTALQRAKKKMCSCRSLSSERGHPPLRGENKIRREGKLEATIVFLCRRPDLLVRRRPRWARAASNPGPPQISRASWKRRRARPSWVSASSPHQASNTRAWFAT